MLIFSQTGKLVSIILPLFIEYDALNLYAKISNIEKNRADKTKIKSNLFYVSKLTWGPFKMGHLYYKIILKVAKEL